MGGCASAPITLERRYPRDGVTLSEQGRPVGQYDNQRLPLFLSIGDVGRTLGAGITDVLGKQRWYLKWETRIVVELTDPNSAAGFLPELLCHILKIPITGADCHVWESLTALEDLSIVLARHVHHTFPLVQCPEQTMEAGLNLRHLRLDVPLSEAYIGIILSGPLARYLETLEFVQHPETNTQVSFHQLDARYKMKLLHRLRYTCTGTMTPALYVLCQRSPCLTHLDVGLHQPTELFDDMVQKMFNLLSDDGYRVNLLRPLETFRIAVLTVPWGKLAIDFVKNPPNNCITVKKLQALAKSIVLDLRVAQASF